MNKSNKIIILIVAFCFLCFASFTPIGRRWWNNYMFHIQKADDETNYETKKKVEDYCRTMIASYTSDKLTYKQYKNSTNSEKNSWSEQAKIRANKTAVSYNEYILKNSYVWENNIPEDIMDTLPYLE